MKLKGISLSIETVVIIVICVLVLVVSVLFFTGVFNPGAETTSIQAGLSRECMMWGWHGYSHEYFDDHKEDYPLLVENFGEVEGAAKYCTGQKELKPEVQYEKVEADKCTPLPAVGEVCCNKVGTEEYICCETDCSNCPK